MTQPDERKLVRIATFVSEWTPITVRFSGERDCVVADYNMARFLAQTDIDPDGCWMWTGAIDDKNYSAFAVAGISGKAYRFSFVVFVGPIAPGLHVDHECHNRAGALGECPGGLACEHRKCVNPRHLRAATPKQNVLSGLSFVAANASKTHCINGHALEGDALYIYPNGERGCRQCRRDVERRQYRAEMAEQGRTVGPPPGERTHCAQGHPYDDENTYVGPNGRRVCRTCRRENALAYYRRNKGRSNQLPKEAV